MDFDSRGDGPAILQLQKWESSNRLDLSVFREAFISPTRELLLLLTYECEALLLPLGKGKPLLGKDFENCDESPLNQNSSTSSSSELGTSNRSYLRENISSTTKPINLVSTSDFSLDVNHSRSDIYPFVYGVKSLAWGKWGDTYDQHEEISLRELLVVSGNHGVTVHAFCQPSKASEATEPSVENEMGGGVWMEWGPSSALSHGTKMQEQSSLCRKTSSCSLGADGSNGNRKSRETSFAEAWEGVPSRSVVSKRWLQTFLVEAETLKSGGNMWTRFPKRTQYPSSATVVSFNIFGHDCPVFDFLYYRGSILHESGRHNVSILNSIKYTSAKLDLSSSSVVIPPDIPSNLSSGMISRSYRCSKVFSSISHHLIGFVFKLVDTVTEDPTESFERNYSKTVLVVARLVSWGMQWVYLLKLDESHESCPLVEWTDFGFSDGFLVCLSSVGIIFYYGAFTGEYVAHMDLLQIFGIDKKLNFQVREHLVNDVVPQGTERENKHNGTSTHHNGDIISKRKFKKLLVVAHTSILAVIDEYGVIYVICGGDLMPGKNYSSEISLSHFQQLKLGALVGWEVGGAEISHPRVFSNFLGSHSSNTRSSKDYIGGDGFHQIIYGKEKRIQHESYDSGFSVVSQKMERKFCFIESTSRCLRKIFLPVDRPNEDDIICLSPFGVTRLVKKCNKTDKLSSRIVHSNFHLDSRVYDDRFSNLQGWEASAGGAIGCTFQGCLYLVTEIGLSVVLPALSVSTNFFPIEAIGYRQMSGCADHVNKAGYLSNGNELTKNWSPWKVEVLDRVLLYEGPEEADHLCLENGWDLKIARLRRLQLALDYLKYEEIKISLELLVEVDMAEEGILRLLFAVVHLIFRKVINDNEVSAASRLLAVATSFATKMIRKYGLLQHKKDPITSRAILGIQNCSSQEVSLGKKHVEMVNLRRLREMAHFLEIIRNLQCDLNTKFKRKGQNVVDDVGELSLVNADLSHDDMELSVVPANALSLEGLNQEETSVSETDVEATTCKKLALMPIDSLDSDVHVNLMGISGARIIASERIALGGRSFALENPKDMIARWEIDNLDEVNVVKDALLFGRLPLAVLKFHLQHLRDLVTEKEPNDAFSEVRDIGRAIAYDLFIKGETGLALATLQKLGEDIETSLKELVFGTVRKSLRTKVAEEIDRYGFLVSYEWKILESISLIERVYPSSCFWATFCSRQKESMRVLNINSPEDISLQLMHPHFGNIFIVCGEIDGVVLGSWKKVSADSATPVIDDDSSQTGYWASAAVWSDSWDPITIDRILLDQPFLMGVNLLWESQIEYHICHNDWLEVSRLLYATPSYALIEGSLQIHLNGLQSNSTLGCDTDFNDYDNDIYSVQELDAVCWDVPYIKILRFSTSNMSSMWLRTLMEEQLAKKFIFLKGYWEGTREIVPLLARTSFITSIYKNSSLDESVQSSSDLNFPDKSKEIHPNALQALHKLVIHHCLQYGLPNLLDLYLDHHKLALDNNSLSKLLDVAGDNQWGKWLFYLRVKGREYDASFSNARSIASHNLIPNNNLGVLEIEDIIRTVDDIAEGPGEMAALATLMYAPVPIQDCLSSGSVNMQCSSAQCTLENLRPVLQQFPMLWHTLVAACFGQDPTCNFLAPKVKVSGYSYLSDYLNWRDNLFLSAARDTSLLQMLPCWFSKAVRRLVQLYVQGPLGWGSGEAFLLRDIDYLVNQDAEISPISWEAAIQKQVEKELFVSSPLKSGLGLEHHLNRGRPLAAFNHLLDTRIQKLKLETSQIGQSSSSVQGHTNVQSDVQMLLAPLTQAEASLLSSVIPLAIMHFEDSMLVSSCAFLLELCGLSASKLQVDIAVLRRISSFYKSSVNMDYYHQLSPKGSTFHSTSVEGDITETLARAFADYYLHYDFSGFTGQEGQSSSVKKSTQAVVLVLQHLEKASLPSLTDRMTCGSWLSSGNGDGVELRSQQKIASQHWNLVTIFCQMHQIPLSNKYLTALARDNDWVGFLSEAQVGGYPFDTVIQLANEFSDLRLKTHILTVLKSMQSRKKVSFSSSLDTTEWSEASFADGNTHVPVELFQIIAVCEKQKNPGEALLLKAKDLCWSILAMVASCFPDVSPLSCLTVWLEITAARETSSIKVNDIASQIASNVGTAVEATNSLPASDRVITFHYNRRNPKRRRLMEPMPMTLLTSTVSDVSCSSDSPKILAAQDIDAQEEIKKGATGSVKVASGADEVFLSLSKMVSVLCEQLLFLPLLRAFEIFLPSCSLLPFIRALQAFSQMRLSEASAHLGSFSARIKEEPFHVQIHAGKEGQIAFSWRSSTAVKAANAMLSRCISPYEKRCLLQLLASTDFGDGGSAATYYRQQYWKINLAEPSLRRDDLQLGNETLDDASLLNALQKNGQWEHARNWARQLEASGGTWRYSVHQVTETQAESMVAEWKEFLWDVQEERIALWSHCQTLFLRHSFPALQAGLFFLKHAEAVEKDLPAKELNELLLLSLQWLSGMITQANPVYPLPLLREIETRVWLLSVESEAQVKSEGDFTIVSSSRDLGPGKSSSIIERTASIITKMDGHINAVRSRTSERNDARENNQLHSKISQQADSSFSTTSGGSSKVKRRNKGLSRRPFIDQLDKITDSEDGPSPFNLRNDPHLQDDNCKIDVSFSRWEERVGPAELERAVLSLLEFGQITAAKQLQHKLSPTQIPSEIALVDAALKLAAVSTLSNKLSISMLDDEVCSVVHTFNLVTDHHLVDPLQVLESLAAILTEGSGRGLCKRIISVVKAANVLGLLFLEAFDKQPIELLQLLSLKAQDSFEEANLLVQTHSMPTASIAQVLAESFLKGLLAAHRGGYMDSQKEEGPAPLLWRFADFLKWAELCPSEPEIGHALMRLVMTGQEIPHACEVELLILSHHFYKSSACLDGVDVLVALAATRVEAYVSEGDFICLARLITGVGNFHALNFILGILIENGQLDLLLQKYSAAVDMNAGTAEAVRGFRMAVLTALKHFNPNDLDAFAMVYNHFDMKHEMASLLESRAEQSSEQWFLRYDKDQNEDLLESMRYFIEAAEVHSSIDAGNKTRAACAQASLVSLQIRMPDIQWLHLSDTNARRALVEQSRFQEALIVAEAYGLNQASEWALVLWNQMLKPELTEQFVAEFVAVLPLQPTMLVELARFYRAEVAARGDQSQFSVWLTGGGLPAEWAKYLGRSFRCLLKRTRDVRLRLQLAAVATGFGEVIDACMKTLDKVPENAGPLVLRKGHGGAYLPLM